MYLLDVSLPSQESEYSFVCDRGMLPGQESEKSCVCVRGIIAKPGK